MVDEASDKLTNIDQSRSNGTSLINSDGHSLFCKYWVNDISSFNPKALVFICHGYAEHCLRYTPLAHELIKHQLYPFAHDHLGHGQSEGIITKITDFDIYVRDVIQHVKEVKEKFPNIPIHLLGHSMGGCISLRTYLQEPSLITGMALIGPAVIPFKQVDNCFMQGILPVLSYVCPQLPVIANIDDRLLTHDTQAVALLKQDPNIYRGYMSACFLNTFLKALNDLRANLSDISCPILILHGRDDALVPPSHTEVLDQKISSKNKEVEIYPNLLHQLHYEEEPHGSQIRKRIAEWLATEQ